MIKNHLIEIYCDLDGVLAEFDNRFIRKMGILPDNAFAAMGDDSVWEKLHEIDPKFFISLEPIRESHYLQQALKEYHKMGMKIMLLTAYPGQYPDWARQKQEWVRKYIGNYPTITVPGARAKKSYSGPYNILIDDYHRTIREWNQVGGKGIYHQHNKYSNTINLLNSAVEELLQ